MNKLLALVFAGAMFVGAAAPADAAVITFSGSITGTELVNSGTTRIFRDGVASVAPTPKTFPGTFANGSTVYYDLFTLSVAPGTVVSVDSTVQESNTFFSLYSTSFVPSNLATNYLGDQGSSFTGADFSVIAPASGVVVFAVNNVGLAPTGQYSADITFTAPSAVPLPGGMVVGLIGAGSLGLGGLSKRFGRRA